MRRIIPVVQRSCAQIARIEGQSRYEGGVLPLADRDAGTGIGHARQTEIDAIGQDDSQQGGAVIGRAVIFARGWAL